MTIAYVTVFLVWAAGSGSSTVVHSLRLHAPVHRFNGFFIVANSVVSRSHDLLPPRSARGTSVRSESFVMASDQHFGNGEREYRRERIPKP